MTEPTHADTGLVSFERFVECGEGLGILARGKLRFHLQLTPSLAVLAFRNRSGSRLNAVGVLPLVQQLRRFAQVNAVGKPRSG